MRSLTLRLLLLLLWSSCLAQDLFENTGLLAEYFAPFSPEESCDPVNGSTQVLRTRLPNLVRRVERLNFASRDDFDIDRCAFEKDLSGDNLLYNCRGQEELRKNFAARYTGYFYIFLEGIYTFQLDAGDGVRMILGHDACPGQLCATRYDVENWVMQNMRKNRVEDGSYGNQCDECSKGIYDNCRVTDWGCEPFSLWQLEGDGGLSGTCSDQPSVLQSTRYLTAGLHAMRIEYFQRGGDARLFFRYSGPDTDGQMIVVPPTKLGFPRSQTWIKEVFDVSVDNPSELPPSDDLGDFSKAYPNALLLYRADDPFQNTGPGEGAFSMEVTDLNIPIYVRWQGYFLFVRGGEYIFRLESDDGGRVTFGGRGMEGEKVMVDNPGMQEGSQTAQTRMQVLSGLHPVRVEFFWKPSDTVASIQRPPGIKVTYTGFDTQGYFLSLSRDAGARMTTQEYDCELRRFEWGGGMSVTRDCAGACFVGFESNLGDRICDNGEGTTSSLECSQYNFDNFDCSPTYPQKLETTARPSITCHQSCPSSNFRRKNCATCSSTTSNGQLCIEAYDDYCPSGNQEDCTFLTCCVAKVSGLNYWGEDCLAFGTASNCSGKLNVILSRLQLERLPMDAAAVYDPLAPRPRPTGSMMSECYQSNCNQITEEFVLNPFTGFYTDQRICPVQESVDPGFQCYEGPFAAAGITDVLTQCQDSNFQYNFCRNRKSVDGRPFRVCCSFLFLNPQGMAECRFMGAAQGSCQLLLEELERNLSSSAFTRISNAQVLKSCSQDGCNSPMDELQGCPAMVNKEPLITDGIRPTEEPGLEQLLEGAVDRPPEPPPWGLIGGLLSVPLGIICIAMLLNKLGVFREAIEPLFHSSKATVVAHDTFIEPQKDLMVNGLGIESKTYGRVEPRALGLRKLHEEDQVLPLALRQKAENAVPEAANAAWVDEVVKEAEIQRERPQVKDTVVLPGTTYTGEGIPCYPEELDMPYMESHALAVQEPNLPRSRSSDRSKSVDDFSSSHHQSVMSGLPSLSNTARSARGSTNRSASKLTALSDTSGVWTSRTGVTVTERALSSTGDDEALSQDMLPELPPSGENADIPEIGHVEGSVSGLVLCPVSVGNLHRPAAAAKRMREAQDAIPRVAT